MGGLLRTPLFDLHVELGARMVPFAGYEMPVQYNPGVMKEHLHTRTAAGLFDVSHMGQVIVRSAEGYQGAARAMETLVPVDLLGLGEGRQRYGFFTNETGGILDDLMLSNQGDYLFVVVNAACKAQDIAHMRAGLLGCEVEEITNRALLALQGPAAVTVLERHVPEVSSMRFMDTIRIASEFGDLWIARSGYTGEDGYEISVVTDKAADLARALLAHDEVEAIGLGARDSLRLEGGLCLYGNDIDTDTTPIEGALNWAIQKVRRTGGEREGGFPGADVVLGQLANGISRKRVGLRPYGRAPMRDGTALFATDLGGDSIGRVTSGAFGPSVNGPVSMGYVNYDYAKTGTRIYGEVRGKRMPVDVADMPFAPAGFKR